MSEIKSASPRKSRAAQRKKALRRRTLLFCVPTAALALGAAAWLYPHPAWYALGAAGVVALVPLLFKKPRASRWAMGAAATCVALLVAFSGALAFRYAVVGGGVYAADVTTLALKDATASDLEGLPMLKRLTSLDLRGSDVSIERRDALAAALPDCDIRWDVPLGGARFDSASAALSLGSLGVDEAELEAALPRFPNLETVDLRGSGVYDEAAEALAARWPQIEFAYQVTVCGVQTDRDATHLDLSGAQYPGARELAEELKRLDNLGEVDLVGLELTAEDASALKAALPSVAFRWGMTVHGVYVSSEDAELNLDKREIADTIDVRACLDAMDGLQTVSLLGNSLTDEQMIELCDAYPDVFFVWQVHFGGDRFKVRTNATAFMTNKLDEYKCKDYYKLKYCKKLLALDLGHNSLKDISFLKEMPQLKVLILAVNELTDISALEGLVNLEYLELFSNKITDISALSGMTKLLDLNLCRNSIKDISPILNLTSLERLWFASNGLSTEQKKQLKAAFPNCECNFSTSNATGEGWRNHKRYKTILKIFEEKREYVPW